MCVTQRSRSYVGVALLLVNRIVTRKTHNFITLPTFDLKCGLIYFDSLRSRREWVPVRTLVPNASAKSRAGREKNGEESS